MLQAILITLVVILTLTTVLAIYVIIRLNKYIISLEETVETYTDRVDNLHDAMQRGLKENLFKDGTLKKPLVSVDEQQ